MILLSHPPEIANLALGQATTQSSQYQDRVSGLAVDGNPNPDALICTHTVGGSGESNPWWQVDLGAVSEVAMVTLVNRASYGE